MSKRQLAQPNESYRIWKEVRSILSQNESAIIETILFNWVSSFIDMTSVQELYDQND